MRRLVGTESALRATRARVDLAMGYPRRCTEADRIGAGIHAPIEMCRTETAFSIEVEDGGAIARIVDAQVKYLEAAEVAALEDEPIEEPLREAVERANA